VGIQRVLISGGGTGGHIYPAIAIASALQEANPSLEFLFVGAEGKMEMEKVPKAGFRIIGLPIVGINRQHMWKNLLFPIKLLRSLSKAFAILKEFKPDLAIGVGGYASGPMLMAAYVKGIPFVIQEQNSFAGITNKLLSKKAQHIFVAYPGMEKFFPKEKIKLLGNPVRKDLIESKSKRAQAAKFFGLDAEKSTVLVIGGSQGARSINLAIEKGLQELEKAGVQLVWQTGVPFENQAKESAAKNPSLSSYVSAFIYEMDLAYAMADIVISRAGALSVSEICLAGKASVLVPFPNASEDHQTENALSLVRQQAALLVKDNEAQDLLIKTALETLANQKRLESLARASLSMGKPKAAQEIAATLLT
jgi:UDP-N-acetylglucosamine--N-acetylmuramyl-(pentapeptide) pyrophosphoryl-undecaprenol N-acetylglucosamine transferase